MRMSQGTPEPRNITPLNPQFNASEALTIPTSTRRCFHIGLRFKTPSISSIRVPKEQIHS